MQLSGDFVPRTEHHKRTRRYWWLNGADSSQLQTFLIFRAEYRRFKELALEALSKLEQSNSERIKQVCSNGVGIILFHYSCGTTSLQMSYELKKNIIH